MLIVSDPAEGNSRHKPESPAQAEIEERIIRESSPGPLCPHMGLPSDPETHYNFASPGNHCHRTQPAASISLAHQEAYCLNAKHRTCPVYQKSWKGVLPEGLTEKAARKGSPRLGQVLAVVGVVVLVALAAILGYAYLAGALPALQPNQAEASGAFLNTITPDPGATQPALPTRSAAVVMVLPSATPTRLASPSTTPTQPASPTATNAPPTPGPGLETPFGPAGEYLLYKVGNGESWGMIARRFAASVEALQAANPLPPGMGLWANKIIVILAGQVDAAAVNPMLVMYLEQGASIRSLAAEYKLNVADLRRLNSLGPADVIPAGRYLILPQTP